jgi:hypothetical protein
VRQQSAFLPEFSFSNLSDTEIRISEMIGSRQGGFVLRTSAVELALNGLLSPNALLIVR